MGGFVTLSTKESHDGKVLSLPLIRFLRNSSHLPAGTTPGSTCPTAGISTTLGFMRCSAESAKGSYCLMPKPAVKGLRTRHGAQEWTLVRTLLLSRKGRTRSPAIYRISYEQNQRDAPKTGELLRFFPVVTDECAWTSFENWFYKSVDTAFPDDPLLNQFFAETAFESYRLLGLGTVDAILAKERALSRTDELDLEDLFTACVKTLRRFPWVDENKSDLTASSIRNCAKESPGMILNTQQKSTRLFSQRKTE